MAGRTKVLFVCIGNACRSQMAEAIARHCAADVIEPSSAGLVPFGQVMPATLAVLSEKGISAEGQYSKPLPMADLLSADLVINMSGRSGEDLFDGPCPPVEDWDVGDPYGSALDVYREIRDEIQSRIDDLSQRLRTNAVSAQKRLVNSRYLT